MPQASTLVVRFDGFVCLNIAVKAMMLSVVMPDRSNSEIPCLREGAAISHMMV